MKRLLTTIFLMFCASAFVCAQTTQSGYVKTKGRMDKNGTLVPGTRIGGVAITLTGGHSTVGDANGNFKLTVPDKKYYLRNVQKQGYTLVDPEVLSKTYVQSANPLVITMELPEKQLEDQLKSERRLRHELQKQLQQKEQEIDSLQENGKITEEEYHAALQKLYAEQSSHEKLISDMARQYAEIDYDLLDEFYRQVTLCIENGDLVKADSLLHSRGDVRQQVEEQLKKGQVLQEQKEKLRKAGLVYAADNEELARRCYSYYEKFAAQYRNDSAAYFLEMRASLDTTDVMWQMETGNYIYVYLAQYDKALSYFQRALRQALSQGDENQNVVATCYNDIGSIYLAQGDYDKALEYGRQSLDIWKTIYGESHPHVASGYRNNGEIYYAKRDYAQALACQLKSLSINQLVYGENDPAVARNYNSIGNVYAAQKDYAKAWECFQKSLSIWRSLYGENHPAVATNYNDIGLIYDSQADYVTALDYYLKAFSIWKSVYGENHPSVATSYSNIGDVYFAQEDYATALEYSQKSLSIWESLYGENHPSVATEYYNIGSVYRIQKDYAQTLAYYQKSLSILKSLYGANHPAVVRRFNTIQVVKDFAIAGTPDSMKRYVFTATTIGSGTAANAQGLSGEYVILEYNDWSIDSTASLFDAVTATINLPSSILIMKGKKISRHHFEGKMGVEFGLKEVGEKGKEHILKQYRRWRKRHS